MHALNPQGGDRHERKPRLLAAAQEGYSPVVYDYGLTSTDPGQQRHWLEMAAQEGNLCAMNLLGRNML